MSLDEPFNDLALGDWLSTAERHRAEGYRLVQMTGTARPDHFEIMISYDKDYRCTNYRTLLPRDRAELPSLSGIFPAAFTYENELKDLFGIAVPGLTVDYGGNFLRTKTKIPFSGDVTVKKEKVKPAAAGASGSEG
ncbi:NADH-quinone oxidoreductase subunit C [Thiorhodococcus mannitoliphagus]|uniref:NADH-quinone oxidoreductase subunit C n=1 Tax=Thiorhodococcus mannitoliphagus TaxID=329406 RepID=A0A6P1DQE9_9GAMM|nr:NADH-quinone oxidoreductase subunit C [Thiorhodococcus mannitoliphagus]NEX20248.1 NADH-quinone oxidoreductase subunit C [Thiorhodococcus mannitoliphagus]